MGAGLRNGRRRVRRWRRARGGAEGSNSRTCRRSELGEAGENEDEMENKDNEALSRKTGKSIFTEYVAVLARWVLGGVFIYMGMSKAVHPEEFLKLVRDYEIIGNPLALNLIAAALPWFEIFCGLLLLAGVAVRGTALVV